MKGLNIFAAAALLAPGAAQATSVAALTLEQQARKAEVIVRVTLGTAQTVKEGDVPYLVYPLEVKEVVAGDVASLPQVGGKPALYFLQGLQDLPKLSANQEVLALLYTRRLDSPVVGFNQGWYAIEDGKVKAGDPAKPITDPAALRDVLRAARGNQ